MKKRIKNNHGVTLIEFVWIIILIAVLVWLLKTYTGPVSPIRRMVRDVNKYGYSDLFDQVDLKGFLLFVGLGQDNLEDFWDKYEKLDKMSENDEEVKKSIADIQAFLDEYADKIGDISGNTVETKMKIKKVVSKEKVSERLYKVKVKTVTETKEKKSNKQDDKEDNIFSGNETMTFYTLKQGLFKYSIVGIEGWSVTEGKEFLGEDAEKLFKELDIDFSKNNNSNINNNTNIIKN